MGFSFQALVEASAKRVVSLAAQWEKHRAPLIDEHRRLREICSSQEVEERAAPGNGFIASLLSVKTDVFFSLHFPQLESSRKLSEIKSLHEKICVSTEEAKSKEEIYKQLVTDSTIPFYLISHFSSSFLARVLMQTSVAFWLFAACAHCFAHVLF